jgi:hypothetical protein
MAARFATRNGLAAAVLVATTLLFSGTAWADSLHSCEIGRHVRVPAGQTGVVTAAEYDQWCVVTLDSGAKEEHTYTTLDGIGGQRSTTATALANGEWDCSVSAGTFQHPTVRAMGRLDVRGLQYRFRPFGNATDGFAPYAVGTGGSLRWGGYVGGLNRSPSRIVESRKNADGGISVKFRVSPTAYVETMTCRRV